MIGPICTCGKLPSYKPATRRWQCACGNWVGVHASSVRTGLYTPLGTLADAETHEARKAALWQFRQLWLGAMEKQGYTKSKARSWAYRRIAEVLGVEKKDVLIHSMDAAMAGRVEQVIREMRDEC